jgi:hypothetical protein
VTEYQAVVHRLSGLVHRSAVGTDFAVYRTLCGRELDDLWYPVSDSDTTCLRCRDLMHSAFSRLLVAP